MVTIEYVRSVAEEALVASEPAKVVPKRVAAEYLGDDTARH